MIAQSFAIKKFSSPLREHVDAPGKPGNRNDSAIIPMSKFGRRAARIPSV